MKPQSFALHLGGVALASYNRAEYASFLRFLRCNRSTLTGMRMERRGDHGYSYRVFGQTYNLTVVNSKATPSTEACGACAIHMGFALCTWCAANHQAGAAAASTQPENEP